MLEEGIVPPFYLDKLKDDGTRSPTVLSMSILFFKKKEKKIHKIFYFP